MLFLCVHVFGSAVSALSISASPFVKVTSSWMSCRVEVAVKQGAEECYHADAVVLAVGVKALQQCAPLPTADLTMQPPAEAVHCRSTPMYYLLCSTSAWSMQLL